MASTINASTVSGIVQSADTSGVLALQTGGTTALTVNASQNVGIGTSSPTYKLDVVGQFQQTAPVGTNSSSLRVNNDAGALYLFRDSSTGSDYSGSAYAAGLYAGGAYSMVFANNGATRMTIDSSGRVTLPYQPAFIAYSSTGTSITTGGSATAVTWSGVSVNVGSSFNVATGRFTAPVSGTYIFCGSLLLSKNTNTRGDIQFWVNGNPSFLYEFQMPNVSTNATVTATRHISLSAGDYVQLYTTLVGGSNGTLYPDNRFNTFTGSLLG